MYFVLLFLTLFNILGSSPINTLPSGSYTLVGMGEASCQNTLPSGPCARVDRDGQVSRLATLDEAFLTSSIKGIVPVVRADEQPIGQGSPGPVTRRLIRRYEDWLEREARPAMDAV